MVLLAPGLEAGVLRGRVLAEPGFRPKPPPWAPPSKDYCGVRPGNRETLLVAEDGGLANCVVVFPNLRERETLPPLPPAPTPVLDNLGCEFRPHVLLVRKKQEYLLRNSDPVFHNVNALTADGYYKRYNIGLAAGAPDMKRVETRAGPLVIRCDAGHTWMKGFIYVSHSRFVTKTDETGAFEIPGIPAGKHKVRLWHERYGRHDFELEIGEGDAAVERNFVAWFDSSPAYGMFSPDRPMPPRPKEKTVAPAPSPTPRVTAAPARRSTGRRRRRRAPDGGGGPPIVLVALWALGVGAAGVTLLSLRRQRLAEGDETSDEPDGA